MTLVDRITKLKHPGTLHNFSWPQDLPNFGRYNLIYGWNGSGKTTISRLFRALEMQTVPPNCEVEFQINGQGFRGPEFDQASLPVRVFNRDFVSANVFQSTGGTVPPILVLGEDSVGNQAQVEKLKANLAMAKTEQHKLRSQRTFNSKLWDSHCIAQAKSVKDTLRSTGENPYNNYAKSQYQKHTQEMLDEGDGNHERLEDNTRDALMSRIHESPKDEIEEINYTFPQLSRFSAKVANVLETSVVSATIKSLQDNKELSLWVHEGIGLHDSYNASRCLFCEQTLPQNHLDTLKAHFNAEYELFLKDIDDQINLIKSESRKKLKQSYYRIARSSTKTSLKDTKRH